MTKKRKNKTPKLCLYGCKNRIRKITKNSTYYRWIDAVGANVKIYPCMHESPDYKAVVALQDKTAEVLKKRDKDVEDLKVKLGECIEQLVLNNKYHEERTARYAKLYVGYKKRYQELFKLREVYERLDDEHPFTEEEKAASAAAKKDFEFKFKDKKLESGKDISHFHIKKKNTKH